MSTGNDNEERGEGSGPGPPSDGRLTTRAKNNYTSVVVTRGSPGGEGAIASRDGASASAKRPRPQQDDLEMSSNRISTIYASLPLGDGESGNVPRKPADTAAGPRHVERVEASVGGAPLGGDPGTEQGTGKRRSDSIMESSVTKSPASRPRTIGPLAPPPLLPTLPRVAPTFVSSTSRSTGATGATIGSDNGSASVTAGVANVPVRGFNYQAHSLLSGISPALLAQMGASLAAANAVSTSTAVALHRSLLQAPTATTATTGVAQSFSGNARGSHSNNPGPAASAASGLSYGAVSQPSAPTTHSAINLSALPLPSSMILPLHFGYNPMSAALVAQGIGPSGVGLAAANTGAAAASGPSLQQHSQSHPVMVAFGQSPPGTTGRPPVPLLLQCDEDALSAYQCLVRGQIELFEANTVDVESNAQGRNRPIVLGQVGIRCRHCSHLGPRERTRGATYYPAQLQGLYQACQNLSQTHLAKHCQHIPDNIRSELERLRTRKSSAGGGKKYWADAARVLGVYEDGDGLRFLPR